MRDLRRWLTAKATRGAARLAPLAPWLAIDVLEWGLGRVGPRLPVLGRMVSDNMRAAGVCDRSVVDAYFRQVALHLSNAVRIFRLKRDPAAVAALARREVVPDESIEYARRAAEEGRGAIIVPAHACNFLVSLARLGGELPLCIYLRWSRDRRRVEIKQQWCRTAGLEVIVEPANAADPTSRAAACVEALRQGKLLVITPDIAQRRGEGVPVRWLGRTAYLPSGPAALAMLAEVPMIPLFARLANRPQAHGERWIAPVGNRCHSAAARSRAPIHVPYFEEPLRVRRLARAEGGRQESLRLAMQKWADGFSRFIRDCPEAWLLWGDSRWTRVLRGDPKYAGDANGAANGSHRLKTGATVVETGAQQSKPVPQ